MREAFPVYRRAAFPSLQAQRRKEQFRGSPRERGYDSQWDKFSLKYRKAHPFCEKCEQDGLDTVLCDDVDHIVPLGDGGAKFDKGNVWALCRKCHNGWKQRAQRIARAQGNVEILLDWCLKPETRPQRLRR